jgi:hypothetical protein
MSWSTGTAIVKKAEVDAAVDALTSGTNDPVMGPIHDDQLRTAKAAAKLLLTNIPGPFVIVRLSGHGNGVGWQKKEGWSNDCITVSVSQMTEGPSQ